MIKARINFVQAPKSTSNLALFLPAQHFASCWFLLLGKENFLGKKKKKKVGGEGLGAGRKGGGDRKVLHSVIQKRRCKRQPSPSDSQR